MNSIDCDVKPGPRDRYIIIEESQSVPSIASHSEDEEEKAGGADKSATPDANLPQTGSNVGADPVAVLVCGMELHPIASLFPDMSPSEFDELVDSVGWLGVQEPILTYQGKILDGRHRAKACEKLKMDCPKKEYTGPDDVASLLRVVAGFNLNRRHLSASQRAVIATEMLPQFEAEARVRQQEGRLQGAKVMKGEAPVSENAQASRRATAEAGKALGVSASTVEKAKRLRESAPELIESIKRGGLTVNAAAQLLRKESEAKQSVMVESVVHEARELKCGWGPEVVSVSLDLPLDASVVADRLEELARKLRKVSGPAESQLTEVK